MERVVNSTAGDKAGSQRQSRLHSKLDQWLYKHSDQLAAIAVLAGLGLRIHAAWGIFLNPDEALHFSLANQGSFKAAYHASLTLAHPPLLVLLLYFWRAIGTSDLLLRLPSVLAGAAFCWIFYLWLKELMGNTVALTGTLMMAWLPPLVALTSEVRQYSLLLVFIASCAFLLERALAKNSAWIMGCSFICLWLAMLSHYSALLFAAAMGIYSALRLLQNRCGHGVLASWVIGQLGSIALFAWLYRVQISRLKGSVLAEQAVMEWLRRSYFHSGDNLAAFVFGRSFAVFQFVFGQLVLGDIAGLLFIAASIFLVWKKLRSEGSGPSPLQLALLLVAPFLVNCTLAVAGKYPYGGTRHCVFLAIFAIAGVSFFVSVATQGRTLASLLAGLAIVTLCYVFGFHHQPYMTRADQSQQQMSGAMNFIRAQIPASAPIFVDEQSNLMLGHYLCGQRPGVTGVSGLQEFACGGHRIISAPPAMWMFTARAFPRYWDQLISDYNLSPGSSVWIVQAGWGANIAPDLPGVRRDLAPSKVAIFGRNISAFELTVKPQQ